MTSVIYSESLEAQVLLKNTLVGACSMVKVEIFGFLIFLATENLFVKSVSTQRSFWG